MSNVRSAVKPSKWENVIKGHIDLSHWKKKMEVSSRMEDGQTPPNVWSDTSQCVQKYELHPSAVSTIMKNADIIEQAMLIDFPLTYIM